MRCQQCEFENMPGMQKCMRCGSVLALSRETVEVHPPRMSRWKKPIRNFLRRMRQFVPMATWSGKDLHAHVFPKWLRKISRVGFLGAFLSVVPGVAHLVQKRFRTIRWWVLGWFILLVLSLFFYGSSWGMALMGLAIGVHVWIAVHSALLKEYEEFRSRLIGYMIILVFFYIGYQNLGRLFFFDIRGGFSATHVPVLQVYRGDFLLGRISRVTPDNLTRGSFVLAHLSTLGGHGLMQTRPLAYVEIIGLPGETITIQNDLFLVNTETLDAEKFPLPVWLNGRSFSTVVPEDSYFISAQYQGTGYNDSQALSVCILNRSEIEAKAFLRWMPLGRRGFISEY